MRIARFNTQGKENYGILENNVIKGMRGSPFTQFNGPGSSFKLDGSTYKLDEVKLMAPCTSSSKAVCVGRNYQGTRPETIPTTPLMFIKPSTAFIGPGDKLILPSNHIVNYEAELAAVIGKKAKNVPEDKAKEYVLGYTCHNDVTDWNAIDEDKVSLTRAKGADTFGPLGPWIETDVDPDDLRVETHVNGTLCQAGCTKDLIFSMSKLISIMSGIWTLLPGDVISTGTPPKTAAAGPMKSGDIIEITIEKIGSLKHFVA